MNFLWDLTRVCPRCGKSWGKFDWLCKACEVWWFNQLRVHHRWISKEIDHYYLFPWERGGGHSHLVYSLKKGGSLRAFQKCALLFPKFPISGDVFFPEGGKIDHGYEWALSLSRGDKERLHSLQKVGLEKQSFLSKNERRKRSFRPHKSTLKHPHFVDDIVTSGGTALGCWRALGQPPRMTVWSLFYRKSL